MRKLLIVPLLLLIGSVAMAQERQQEGQLYWLEDVKIDGDFAEWTGLKPMVTKNSLLWRS